MPELSEELTIGTGPGLFILYGGDTIRASPATWQRALSAWKEVLAANEPKLIVLDKDQAGWCDPNSHGRF